jgi:hypothetical protein
VSTSSTFASVSAALGTLEAAMDYLAAADTTQMPTVVQAQCLQTFERTHAVETVARARVLAAFTSSQGYHEDAAYSSRSWLTHQTQITRGAASRHVEWAARAVRTPQVIDRLARKEVSESLALVSCGWADKMPEGQRDEALKILLDAAQGGADQRDLNMLGAEMLERCQGDAPDQDPEPSFQDRAVRLDKTLGGVVTREWITRTRGQWAAARAANSVAGGDGGAWLDGADATGFACDASISPIVTGDIDPSALEDLVRLCVELAGYAPHRKLGGARDKDGADGPGGADAGPRPPTERGREALEQAIIGKAIDLLSGPGGLASFLRRRLLGAKLAGPSLPLDVGMAPPPRGTRTSPRPCTATARPLAPGYLPGRYPWGTS